MHGNGIKAYDTAADSIGVFADADAAKAALEADYEARSLAALDVQPLTVQDAARVPADFQALVNDAMAEATRAMAKFPQPNYVISKFAEESGEVVKAAIHYAEGREARDAVVSEMRQTIAMMLRLWIEGDQVHGLRAITEEL